MISRPAVLPLEGLADAVRKLQASGKSVAHARGVFDVFDEEQLRRLREARDAADALVVTVAAGGGSHAPVLAADLRAQVVASLPFVHAVSLEETTSRAACVERVGADVLVDLLAPVEPIAPPPSGNSVVDASERKELVYKHAGPYTPEAEAFLREFRRRYTADDVIDALAALKKLKVLVVGDAIVDEYHFVRPYGMPLKAPIIAAQYQGEEAYAGGILAVANHIAGFCGDVHLVTTLGELDSREEFIRAALKPNVRPKFFFRPNAPTVVKRRYLLRFLVQKLFEVGFFDDRPLPEDVDAAIGAYLREACKQYDLVVVADFGHGLLSQASVDILSNEANFLAINTQLNSINYGYHVITKYGRADYVCIDEPEMRMACRDRFSPLEELLPPLAKRLHSQVVTVTRGHRGSLTYLPNGVSVEIPIVSRQVVDTIGAGDAYLSITAPCVKVGMPPELIGFIGNAVGGLAVRIVGNRAAVGPEPLFDFIRALLAPS